MKELSQESVVSRGSEHVETQVGGQTLMMSVSQGKYFSVDQTANRIWVLIERPVSVRHIVETLTREYDVNDDECAGQVKAFLSELIENGLAVEH